MIILSKWLEIPRSIAPAPRRHDSLMCNKNFGISWDFWPYSSKELQMLNWFQQLNSIVSALLLAIPH